MKPSKKRSGPGPVLRFTVERRDGKWSVIDRFRAPEMTIPSSSKLPSPGKTGRLTGAWFEAVDAKGNLIYRRMLREPQDGVELFHEDGSISRATIESVHYTTDILIPDLPEIQTIHLYIEKEVPLEAKVAPAPIPVAKFPAREKKSPKRSRKKTGNRR